MMPTLFWRGLYQLRKGEFIVARAEFIASHTASHALQVDPVLYWGGLNLRDGQPRDALRVLADANKLRPQCPLVSWQLGTALMATGGDAMLAIRAGAGHGGGRLPELCRRAARLRIETLPADSWVRNVVRRAGTQRSRYQCPLGFDNPKALLAAARLTLADALVVCQRPNEAVMIFHDLLRTDDSLPVRRGLGFALSRHGKIRQKRCRICRKRTALENPPQTRTLGTLAQCLANAKGDRVGNVQQALALIASQPVRSDAIWARHAGAVFAIAHGLGLPVKPAQIAELADVLISSNAADRTAATVYDLLALCDPAAVPREAAWLYTRAAEATASACRTTMTSSIATFSERAAMERFFEANDWDFAAVERLYLTRWAERHPGSYPTGPGPGYAAQAGNAPLGRLAALGEPGANPARRIGRALGPVAGAAKRGGSRSTGRIRISAGPARCRDRLAEKWEKLYPTDPTPIARRALIEQTRSGPRKALLLIRQALDFARGHRAGPIALAAGRIATRRRAD